jgi:murein DD-endopeptidase MepM/ murein hydrolase activator NlpD
LSSRHFGRRRFGPRQKSGSFFWANSLIGRREADELPAAAPGALSVSASSSEAPATLVERVWTWTHETFPERQVYIRSDGRVQFFTFSPTLQATIAGLSLIFITWIAFATVNVVFKDRIIAAKNHRYQEMQSAYENRVADLQGSYDELNGSLVSAEDKFKATAEELQTKQNTIMKFIIRKQQVDSTLRALANGGPAVPPAPAAAPIASAAGAPVATAASTPVVSAAPAPGFTDADTDASGVAESSPAPVYKSVTPPPVKPTRASLLDLDSAVGRLSGLLFGSRQSGDTAADAPETLLRHPALKALAIQTERVKRIGVAETELLTGTEQRLTERVASLQGIIRHTGIDPAQYVDKLSASEGVGGPDIPLQSIHIDGIADSAFENAYMSASAVLERMDGMLAALRHIPLTTPVHGSEFERTSGFGPRVDPFTGHYSFHPGIDFAGPYGSTVTATAPGTVVWAGMRGGYGNLVEIDHGLGVHTRYGHLASFFVHAGSRVAQGTPIGKLGSTGRSTGPHVHYEVWYNEALRNPANFIEAGRHVIQ